ncbi:MAG: tetratricopeptide repeat protein [Candidatus Electryonea clarkiae]|nr:tetratricopeptide repeat protein [Candidatus Electryonea clarkiae]MDP8286002.1 tetratricopeptide repeat protein [Candidatus Electryonea clarkiae]
MKKGGLFALSVMLLLASCSLRTNPYKMIDKYSKKIEANPNDTIAFMKRGNYLDEAREYDRAISDFNSVIKIDSNFSDAYTYRGLTYLKKGNKEQAMKDFNKAIELNPQNEMAFANRGKLYNKIGELDLAINDHSKAIEIEPAKAWNYYERATLYFQKKDFEKSLADLNKVIELDHELERAYTSRAMCYSKMGNNDQALSDFNNAIDANPGYALPYYFRGNIYKEKGDLKKARNNFEKAIELGYYRAQASLDEMLLDEVLDGGNALFSGKPGEAVDHLNKAEQIDPEMAGTVAMRGLANKEQGLYPEAIKGFTQAIKLQPDSAVMYYYFRGTCFLKMRGGIKKAIDDFDVSLQLSKDIHEKIKSLEGLHQAHSMSGQIENSINDLKAILELDPSHAGAYHAWGQVLLLDKKDIEGAIEKFTRAIELDSSDWLSYDTRALIYGGKLSKFDLAIKDFSKVIELQPHIAKNYKSRAIGYWKNQDYENALADFTKAIELEKDNRELAKLYIWRSNVFEKKGDMVAAEQDSLKYEELNK